MKLFKRLDDFGDSKLTLKRNQGRDAFWFRLSKSADHSFIWFLLGLIKYAFDRDTKQLIVFIVVMASESTLTNGPIKYIFKRKRPYENEKLFDDSKKLPFNMRRPKTSSFPSGHATAGICAAILLGINEPFLYLGLIPLGIMVGYSRMYTKMHHLSNILAEFILGLAYGLLAINVIY